MPLDSDLLIYDAEELENELSKIPKDENFIFRLQTIKDRYETFQESCNATKVISGLLSVVGIIIAIEPYILLNNLDVNLDFYSNSDLIKYTRYFGLGFSALTAIICATYNHHSNKIGESLKIIDKHSKQ